MLIEEENFLGNRKIAGFHFRSLRFWTEKIFRSKILAEDKKEEGKIQILMNEINSFREICLKNTE